MGAQFAVYRNKDARTAASFPLLVDVQSDLLEELETRVVIPLSRDTALTRKPMAQLTPVMKLEGEAYVLLTPQIAAMARRELGTAVGTLARQRDTILAALDFLITGF